MNPNPYKYTGPLDPIKDKLVCIPRTGDLEKVINGIRTGKYWAVLGPRQIGKSTFLSQLEQELSKNTYCLYFNFEILPARDETNFYKWLMNEFTLEIPAETSVDTHGWEEFDPHFRFYYFLEKFRPKDLKKKIILLFDEIERVPQAKNFLHLWRKVYHDRNRKEELNRYTAVIAGSLDLMQLTVGPNSPFNIAEKLNLDDFSYAETQKLVTEPLSVYGIEIAEPARELVINQASGHPQLTQQLCHFLVEKAQQEKQRITEAVVAQAVDYLLNESINLDILKQALSSSHKLEKLIREIIGGIPKKYHPYKEFGIAGSGAIVEDKEHCCTIRNKVYERFLRDILEISTAELSLEKGKKEPQDEVFNYTKRYKIIAKVGKGSIGMVYKAEDTWLKRIVALKMLTNKLFENQEELARLKTEAMATAQLSHPNIVTIYDIGELPEGNFFAMEFIEGENLSSIIRRLKWLDFSHVIYIATQLARALDYSHQKGVIHRDIKPQNIMVTNDGEIKIVDFGIAVVKDHYRKDESDLIIGTPSYVSPEQIKGEKTDHRADIYSTGVTLFHMVAGILPFSGENIYKKHLSSPIPSIKKIRSNTPDKLIKIINKCMEKSRQKRYQGAGELLQDLKVLGITLEQETAIKREIKFIFNPGLDKNPDQKPFTDTDDTNISYRMPVKY